MATYYLEILALQSPIPIGVDAKGRDILTCNFSTESRSPTSTFENDIRQILINGGLVTYAVEPSGAVSAGTNVFIGPSANIPDGDGPWIIIRPTGGISPEQTHNGDKLDRFYVQIAVYGKPFNVARDKIGSIYTYLDGQHRVTI